MSVLPAYFTYQLGDSGVLLNDDTSADTPFVDIDSVTGLDSAPIRQTKRDHEGTDGGFMDAEYEQGRDIILEGTVFGNGTNIEPYLDDLKANWAASSTNVPLYLSAPGVEERVLFVKPLGCNYMWDQGRRLDMAAVKFSCYAEDPRIYSSTLTTTAIVPVNNTVFTGFSFPLSFNFGFGGVTNTADGFMLINNGNRPSPVVFTMTGPLTDPQIISDELSATMMFDYDLATGETLVVDTGNRTVRLNGTSNRRSSLLTNQWFLLAPGENYIRFRSTAGSGTLSASYRSAYR